MSRRFEILATSSPEGKTLVLRVLGNRAQADIYAANASISDRWHKVWVEERAEKKPVEPALPAMPWSVLWQGGYAYIVDADGRKIMSLLGSQKQREFVASVVCDITLQQVYPPLLVDGDKITKP
jgi:hypothetical protein